MTQAVPLKLTSVESQKHHLSRTARKSTGGKPPKKSSADDSEIEEILDPNTRKGKGKAKATESDEDHVQQREPRKNGKRNATSDDEEDAQVVESPPKKQRTKTGRAGSEGTRTRTKPSSRATSKQPSKEKDDSGADVAQKNPKKRKINIFPTGNDVIQFSFGGNVCFP